MMNGRHLHEAITAEKGALAGLLKKAEPTPQGFPGDPESPGGLVLTPTGVREDSGQEEPIDVSVDLGVHVAGIRVQLLLDQSLQAGIVSCRSRGGLGESVLERREEGRQKDGAGCPQEGLLEDALQLADVPRPGVALLPLQCLRGDFVDLTA